MQIMIDIPEDDYYDALQYAELKVNTEFENLMITAIKNGVPIPKGHGRLIDADELKTLYPLENDGLDLRNNNQCLHTALDEAPPIIEADKESEEQG